MAGAAMSTMLQTRCESAPLRVLMIEDRPDDAELALAVMRRDGINLSSDRVQTRDEVAAALATHTYDVVLAGYNLPEFCGMETLEIMRELGLRTPLILVTGALQSTTAVECVKQGASDYVLKDSLTRLPLSIRRALKETRLREERTLAQQELAAKVQELARSNADLEQFAYVASHDLQEPLRMVAAYTQLLAERYQGRLDATADRYIGYAVEGSLRMQTLIEDLLAFSRVSRADRLRVAMDCSTIVDEAMRNLTVAIAESHAQITRDPLPCIVADQVQLLQLFQNLLGNAIKFRGNRPPAIHISAQEIDGEWLFSIRDNGIGIAPEHAEFIFKIFQRLHTRSEYEGNGVGLAICKKIIEQHSGRIWVDSIAGKGATFRFTFPLKSADDHSRYEKRS